MTKSFKFKRIARSAPVQIGQAVEAWGCLENGSLISRAFPTEHEALTARDSLRCYCPDRTRVFEVIRVRLSTP